VAVFETKLKLHRVDNVSVRATKRYLPPGRPKAEAPFEPRYRVHDDLGGTRRSINTPTLEQANLLRALADTPTTSA